jgi:NAD(P)H-hydrate epimerase
MKEIERASYEEYSLNESLIIEMVGIRGADFFEDNFLKKTDYGEIVVLVGKGNNGADGLSIARQLKNRGHKVRAFLLFPSEIKKNSELGKQLSLAKNYGVKITEVKDNEQINGYFTQTQEDFLVIDAILGTGTRLPLSQNLFEIINLVNKYATTIVAIDIPSGITGDGGEMSSTAIEAGYTLAIGLPKTGYYMSQGMRHAGKIYVLKAGLPKKLLEAGDKQLLMPQKVGHLVKKRDKFDHKNRFGHLLVLGGSKGLTGALIMAASAGLKVGAGLVSAVTWEDNYIELVTRIMPEVMTGTIPKRGNLKDVESVLRDMNRFSAIVLGPGLGKSPEARELLTEVLNNFSGPLVLDADALKLLDLKRDGEILRQRKAPTILTPHVAEFADFTGISREDILTDPIGPLRNVIDETNCTFVIKGPCSFIGNPNGEIFINYFPNDGMATGGSGDVLAGIIGGFLAQIRPKVTTSGMFRNPERYYEAVSLGVCLHTLAGKYAAKKYGNFSMTAGSVIECFPQAFKELSHYGPKGGKWPKKS